MRDKPHVDRIDFDPNHPTKLTESGELERPQLKRRRIDCDGSVQTPLRTNASRGGRRREDRPLR